MFCVFELLQTPIDHDPRILKFEVVSTPAEADKKVKEFIKAFLEVFDCEVYPGEGKDEPEVVLSNDDVTGLIYKREY